MFSIPTLRRELIVSSRRRGIFSDRVVYAGLLLAAIGTMELVWVLVGGDRASSFAALGVYTKTVFGTIVLVQALFVFGMVPVQVAPIVARERDRKTLDALLATELSSAEIVVGALAGSLTGTLEKLAIALPVMLLLVPLGGVDPRLIVMAYAGLASTAFAIGAIAIVCSTTARTARFAVAASTFWVMTWMIAPWFTVFVLPRIWPAAASWLAPIAAWVVDSGPVPVVMSLARILSRGGGALAALARMIAWQIGGGALLVAWAIVRLRPASRALHDAEGRTLLRRMLQTRRRPRPPVGDDPVLWNERYTTRGENALQRLIGSLILVSIFSAVAFLIYVFAIPSFQELIERGYVASPPLSYAPLLSPVARASTQWPFSAPPTGFARFEFNVVLRITTDIFLFLYPFMVAALVSESLLSERERDTWLGLIATPLSGRQILGSKILGTIWKTDLFLWLMLGLWLLGLITGAVHPIGFVAVLAELGISTWFVTATVAYLTIWSRDREQVNARVLYPFLVLNVGVMALFFLPARFTSVFFGLGSIPLMGDIALLSYDDVQAAIHLGTCPRLATIGIHSEERAWTILAAFLIHLGGHAALAFFAMRAAFRGFDASVGRPMRAGIACASSDARAQVPFDGDGQRFGALAADQEASAVR